MCSTGSCGSCTQVLNVVSVPMTANDTNSVDLTLTGSTLTADVIHDPNGGTETTASGIAVKLDPDVCNALTTSASGLKVVEHTTVAIQQDYPAVLLTVVGTSTFIEMTVNNPSSCRSLTGMFFINEHAAWQDSAGIPAGSGASTLPVQVLLNGIQQNYVTSNYYAGGTASQNNSSGAAVNAAAIYRVSRVDVSNGVKMVPVTIAPSGSAVIRTYCEFPLPGGGLFTTSVIWQDLQIGFLGSTI